MPQNAPTPYIGEGYNEPMVTPSSLLNPSFASGPPLLEFTIIITFDHNLAVRAACIDLNL